MNTLDTTVKVAICVRCKQYVFACTVNGFRVAVDLAPLDVEGYRAALVAGKDTYDQLEQSGRPWKLQRRSVASQWPPWAGRKVLASHGCGTKGMNTAVVEEVVLDPKAPVSSLLESSLVAMGSHVPNATQYPIRCDTCKEVVNDDKNIVGVQLGSRWIWANHAYDCMSPQVR